MLILNPVEKALEDIGWGWYQTKLYFNCFAALALTMLWIETSAIIMYKFDDDFANSKSNLAISINLGTLVGCYVFSYLIGIYGRAPIFKVTVTVAACGGILICIFPCYEILLFGLFVIGLGMGGDGSIATTVFMEAIPVSQHRSVTILNVSYCLGTALSIFFAILLEFRISSEQPAWLILTWISTIISVILTYLRLEVLESPMFLYEMKSKQLKDVIKTIATINGKVEFKFNLPHEKFSTYDEETINSSALEIFKNPLLSITILQTIQYFWSSVAYTNMIFFMPLLLPESSDLSAYSVIFLQQIAGFLGTYIASKCIDTQLGRKGTEALAFLLSGITIYPFMFSERTGIIYIWSAVSFGFLMMGLSTLYTHSQELYPTQIRGIGVGWVTGIQLMTGVITPPLTEKLGEIGGNSLIFHFNAICYFISALASLFLTEQTHETKEIECIPLSYEEY